MLFEIQRRSPVRHRILPRVAPALDHPSTCLSSSPHPNSSSAASGPRVSRRWISSLLPITFSRNYFTTFRHDVQARGGGVVTNGAGVAGCICEEKTGERRRTVGERRYRAHGYWRVYSRWEVGDGGQQEGREGGRERGRGVRSPGTYGGPRGM